MLTKSLPLGEKNHKLPVSIRESKLPIHHNSVIEFPHTGQNQIRVFFSEKVRAWVAQFGKIQRPSVVRKLMNLDNNGSRVVAFLGNVLDPKIHFGHKLRCLVRRTPRLRSFPVSRSKSTDLLQDEGLFNFHRLDCGQILE